MVEDDSGIRDILQIILSKAGYEVILYSDGNHLMNETIIPGVNLFLIDRQLSGIDGLEICRHLKTRTATTDIPVVILSASPAIQRLTKDAGAVAFIEKPFVKKHLLETVERYIK